MRWTQFSGNHPFCDEHARQEANFGKEDPSYYFWTEYPRTITLEKFEKNFDFWFGQVERGETFYISIDDEQKVTIMPYEEK